MFIIPTTTLKDCFQFIDEVTKLVNSELGSISNVFYSKAYIFLPLYLFVKHKISFLFYWYFVFYPFVRHTVFHTPYCFHIVNFTSNGIHALPVTCSLTLCSSTLFRIIAYWVETGGPAPVCFREANNGTDILWGQ